MCAIADKILWLLSSDMLFVTEYQSVEKKGYKSQSTILSLFSFSPGFSIPTFPVQYFCFGHAPRNRTAVSVGENINLVTDNPHNSAW